MNKIIIATHFTLVCCFTAIVLSSAVLAQELSAKFMSWNVFTTKEAGKKICYIISVPIKQDSNYGKRGESYLLVTHTADESEEIIASSGYNYQETSQVELSFGLIKFDLFGYKNLAWADNRKADIEIIKNMKNNLDVVIMAKEQDSSYSQDTYSLIGFSKAYSKMRELCRMEEPLKLTQE